MELDRKRLRELFDLGGEVYARSGGGYADDPRPGLHRLRETGPVHEGTVHELLGFEGPAAFHGLPYPDRPHYSAFSFEACARDRATPRASSSLAAFRPVEDDPGAEIVAEVEEAVLDAGRDE